MDSKKNKVQFSSNEKTNQKNLELDLEFKLAVMSFCYHMFNFQSLLIMTFYLLQLAANDDVPIMIRSYEIGYTLAFATIFQYIWNINYVVSSLYLAFQMIICKVSSDQSEEYDEQFMPLGSLIRLWAFVIITYYHNEKSARQGYLKSKQIEHLMSE